MRSIASSWSNATYEAFCTGVDALFIDRLEETEMAYIGLFLKSEVSLCSQVRFRCDGCAGSTVVLATSVQLAFLAALLPTCGAPHDPVAAALPFETADVHRNHYRPTGGPR